MILKRPVHSLALSTLIIKLAASDDGESALARVMHEISRLEFAPARVGGEKEMEMIEGRKGCAIVIHRGCSAAR